MRPLPHAAATFAVAALLVVVATACIPPSAMPVVQSLPPGGRVVVQGLPGANMSIEDTNADLSAVAYLQNYYTLPDRYARNGRYWLYDDRTKTSTLLPLREDPAAGPSGVAVGPDGRWIVFGSPDPALQVGPVQPNCRRYDGLFQPMPAIYCAELYRYDLDTGELTQLTGLQGSSDEHHYGVEVSADGRTVEFDLGPMVPESGFDHQRLDLATGAIEELPEDWCCTWVRGTHEVRWRWPSSLESTDLETGEVTRLVGGGDRTWHLEWASNDGRYVVVGTMATPARDTYLLVDTDTGTTREVPSPWLSDDATSFSLVQRNVAPSADDRLVLAPVQW